MIQEILAFGVVMLALLYVGYILYRRYLAKGRQKNTPSDGCAGCPGATACTLKDLKTAYEKKKEGCNSPERLN